MDSTTKAKTLNLEDYQGGSRVVLNKVFGNDGTCSTAAATAAKTVTLGTTFNLVAGATLIVKFTHGITCENSTLAITHTPLGAQQPTTEAAKPIYLNGAPVIASAIPEGSSVILRYNGTQFDIIGGAGATPEVEIGENTPVDDVKIFIDEAADPSLSIDVYTRAQTDTLLGGKADKLIPSLL